MTNLYYDYSEKIGDFPSTLSVITNEDEIKDLRIRKTISKTCHVLETTYSGTRTNTLTFEPNDSHITILFNLGQTVQISEAMEDSVQLDKNCHMFLSMRKGIPYWITFNINNVYKLVLVQLRPDYTEQLTKIRPLDPSFLKILLPTSFVANHILQDILLNQYKDSLRTLLYEAKIQELIVHQIHEAEKVDMRQTKRVPLFENDIKNLHNAKENIENNYKKPLTIRELAKHVGINEHKLKNGFRELFDTTTYSYLLRVRMEHARKMLLNGESVTSIASYIGYENTGNFSNAFKKYHGCTPSHYAKKYRRD